MKRFLLPSLAGIAQWERTRKRGVVRFVALVGISWLLLSLVLMGLLELVRPAGFFSGLSNAFSSRPLWTTGVLLGVGIAFGLVIYFINEALYQIARRRVEP